MANGFMRTQVPALIVISGIAISAFIGISFYEKEGKSISNEFLNELDIRANSLYREVVLNLEAVQSMAILFNGSSIPDLDEFRREADKILDRHKDIQALEWMPRVPQAERAKYESEMRKVYPDFQFTERQASGHMRVAKKRAVYYPVYYVEPPVGNSAALGFDLSSNEIRVKALMDSRDSGKPQVTGSITLVQENRAQKALLALLPVYKGMPTTLERRREQLRGFVLGVFRVGDVFMRSQFGRDNAHIFMELIDRSVPGKEDVLYKNTISEDASDMVGNYYKYELPDIWGRKWYMLAAPAKSYISARRSQLPMMIFGYGLLFSIAIAIYINIIINREMVVRSQVVEKTKELNVINKKLEQLSLTDGLTGVANRRYMDEYLEKEWMRAIREQMPISFILIDIDFFKSYNDHYGHLMGDDCLKRVAEKLKGVIQRPADLLARYGGEEFAVVLPGTMNAELIARACRESIEELHIPHDCSEASNVVSVSVGLCSFVPSKGTDPSLIIAGADKGLYNAKAKGRNRVEVGEV